MRVCTLASGSSGNSLLIETKYTKILVDAGITRRQLIKRLNLLDVELEEIDAVVTTHEHQDHTVALTRLGMPVYVTASTVHLWKDKVSILNEFDAGSDFRINDLIISPFTIPHDAIDPVGFAVNSDSTKVGIVTDIGSVTGLVVEKLRNSNILVIESNHDSDMILYSKYPWELKQRIKSRLGHLSNDQAAELLGNLLHDGLRHVILAHLSEVNNKPKSAMEKSLKVLKNTGADNIKIQIAPRKKIGEVIEI